MYKYEKTYREPCDKHNDSQTIEAKYSSVEFSLDKVDYLYQFKIWETSIPGINILVNQNSEILKYLRIGNAIDMKYYPSDYSGEAVTMRTEIRHIKTDFDRRMKGHCLIGLSVNEIGENN